MENGRFKSVIAGGYSNKKIEAHKNEIKIVLFKSDKDIEISKKALNNLIRIINAPYAN